MRFCLLLFIFLTLPSFAIAQSEVSGALAGVVFEDTDGDGRRGPGEPGPAGVVVCSRSDCAQTDGGGIYEVVVEPGYRVVYVSEPDGYRGVRAHWRRVPADPFEWLVNFPLEKTPSPRTSSFIHASDTHLDEESLPRIRLLRELTEARGVDFVIITFNHIPLFSAVIHGWSYYPDGGSLIEIDGREQYRHMVSNYAEVLERFVEP